MSLKFKPRAEPNKKKNKLIGVHLEPVIHQKLITLAKQRDVDLSVQRLVVQMIEFCLENLDK